MALGMIVVRRTAVAVSMLLAMMSVSAVADDVPEGWKRNDCIAYLILSDFLRDMSNGSDKIFVACISNSIGTDELFSDPSPKLLSALATAFADREGVRLRQASECEETTGEVRERKSGTAAMYVWVNENKDDPISPGLADCGEFTVDWHRALLGGGGAYYHLLSHKTLIDVERDGFCMKGE